MRKDLMKRMEFIIYVILWFLIRGQAGKKEIFLKGHD
jgi:uncharacterized membrane protein (DUF373 family)